jgi:hypothetical protein
MLIGGDFSGTNGTSFHRSSFKKATEPVPEVVIQSNSFSAAREVPVPQEKPLSGEVSLELAPRVGDSMSEEVPTPLELSSETEDFLLYRPLESNQIPIKLEELTPP